ncbi:hypothetical protein CC80DRAFT_261559 [Byssothecium circinans]|uniref:Uncharacterized protein n=1 Tax=Byssothecium circinans TaxID=147558 RepID=A0A6A5UCI9_9PLEO|nr:hypothetical protein CC80DRAFT_261559 [Byssothecium circinans]
MSPQCEGCSSKVICSNSSFGGGDFPFKIGRRRVPFPVWRAENSLTSSSVRHFLSSSVLRVFSTQVSTRENPAQVFELPSRGPRKKRSNGAVCSALALRGTSGMHNQPVPIHALGTVRPRPHRSKHSRAPGKLACVFQSMRSLHTVVALARPSQPGGEASVQKY